ncbi:MAG: trypsin-like serine protease [Bosea sp.]|uniref:S1 family peptidase n=1 Tax=Bosea sp. (in: a-proteobacteria) TaxID=1871050 RepID=UPI001AC93E05|nr:trypsin-like serine protease [Bosea sp. (in: a-proteobacteria)]MBN9451751.1 trypsin-like serine protease [Bosea sp. (in: a-proteobacteria)]
MLSKLHRAVIASIVVGLRCMSISPVWSQDLICGELKVSGRSGQALAFQPKMMPNATEVPAGQLPAQASLAYVGNNLAAKRHFCGAVFLSSRRLLTAAHCLGWVDGAKRAIIQKPDELRVVISRNRKLDATGQSDVDYRELRVTGFECHRGWKGQGDGSYTSGPHDIAIVQIEDGAPSWAWSRGGNRPIVALPADAKEELLRMPIGSELIATGWGGTSDGAAPRVSLQMATMIRQDRNTCDGTFDAICLRQKTSDSAICGNDSGGFAGQVEGDIMALAGIVGGGPRACGADGQSDYYTRVSSHADWIRSIVGPANFDVWKTLP